MNTGILLGNITDLAAEWRETAKRRATSRDMFADVPPSLSRVESRIQWRATAHAASGSVPPRRVCAGPLSVYPGCHPGQKSHSELHRSKGPGFTAFLLPGSVQRAS